MKKAFAVIIVALALVMVSSVGCTSQDFIAKDKASREVAGIWGVESQDLRSDVKDGVGGSWSESHRMMATMILIGAGMDSDFKAYDEVFLIDIQTSDGSNSARVVVVEIDGQQEVIVPQAIKDQGTIK